MNEQKRNLWKRGKRLLAALLTLALVTAYLPAGMLTAQAETDAAQTEGETTPVEGTADGHTDDETQTPPAEDEDEEAAPAEEEPGTVPAENDGTVPVKENNSMTPAAGEPGASSRAGNEIISVENSIAALAETGGNILETGGGAVTWEFRDQSAPIYTEHKDGSLSVSGTFSCNGPQHGANIGNDTVFTLAVPEGLTTITFGVCQYGSSTAKITANETVLEESFSLSGASSDGQEVSVEYSAESKSEIVIQVTGVGFLHSIAAETITPPELAEVSGTVSSEAGGGVISDRPDPGVYRHGGYTKCL